MEGEVREISGGQCICTANLNPWKFMRERNAQEMEELFMA